MKINGIRPNDDKPILTRGQPVFTTWKEAEIARFAPRRAEVHMEIARGYASRFTEAELKDILAFYRTPLGKKLIVEEPIGVDEATKRVDAWAGKYADEVLTRLRAEMKKKGHNLL